MRLLGSDKGRDGTEAGVAPARPQGTVREWVDHIPFVLVGLAICYNLVELAPELHNVATLNDSAMHSEMVRFALQRIRAGHLPFTSWFPFLNLGSPQFLHYQSLGATLTALLGVGIGANHAFSISLYLLLATWPLSIYLAVRLFGLDRWAAGCAAACAPFVSGVLGIGYGAVTYLFVGYGMWAQLWGMWFLPLSWGASFAAVRTGRHRVLAAALIALTASLHFMTGYLAFLVVPIFALLSWRDLGRHLARAASVLIGAALAASWVVVPLLHFRPYAAVNESLVHGPDANSYGAPKVLTWLVHGQLLDANRFPVLTLLALVGLVSCLWAWKRNEAARAIPLVLLGSLVLFFGRPTLGVLENLLPGHRDLFMRRFGMGVQLAAILLSGMGAAALGRLAWRALQRGVERRGSALGTPVRLVASVLAIIGLGAVLTPAWTSLATLSARNTRYINAQQLADASSGRQVAQLVATARRLGGGRIYAGMPTNWGLHFTVGAVPVFRYLAYLDVDEVGFTSRTASLMSDPEVHFDESNPGDYQAFGVRFLLLPSSMSPPVPAKLVARRGTYSLWSRGAQRYLSVVDTVGPPIVANRTDFGQSSASFLASSLPDEERYPTVAFDGHAAARPTLVHGAVEHGWPGVVRAEHDRPAQGRFAATVAASRRAVVLLSASYDPGWAVTVDGAARPAIMVAPALVGVVVGPGTHHVVFTYHGYRRYPLLWVLGLVGLALAGLGGWAERRFAAPGRGGPELPGSGDEGEWAGEDGRVAE